MVGYSDIRKVAAMVAQMASETDEMMADKMASSMVEQSDQLSVGPMAY